MSQVEQFRKMEKRKLPLDFDYSEVPSLRIEAVQKLNQVKPASMGQASRISGVSPADISVLMIYMERKRGREGNGEDDRKGGATIRGREE